MYLLFGMYYLLQKNLYLSLCKKINVIIAKKPNDNVAERENEKNTVHVLGIWRILTSRGHLFTFVTIYCNESNLNISDSLMNNERNPNRPPAMCLELVFSGKHPYWDETGYQ